MRTNKHQFTTGSGRSLARLAEFRRPIHRYRESIRQRFAANLNGHRKLIELSLNEAEALAWQTPFPHLFFPALADEKARSVILWRRRQHALQRRGAERTVVE